MLTYCASATVYKLNVPWSVCASRFVFLPPAGGRRDPGRGFVIVRNVHFMVHIRGMILTRVNLKSSAIVSRSRNLRRHVDVVMAAASSYPGASNPEGKRALAAAVSFAFE
jgi:hypothetical protein